MRRLIPAIVLVALLFVGGGLIASSAYQAGLSAAATTTTVSGATVVFPAYGYGWQLLGPGLSFFGFLGTLLFLFLVFGLIRAVFFGFGRRGRHRYGWGPDGQGGPDRWGGPAGWGPRDPAGHRPPWEGRVHETFEDWHRRAHDGSTGSTAGSTPPPAPPTTPAG